MNSSAAAPALCYQVSPGSSITGRIRVPGDKSISHRAVILGALASGSVAVTGLLEGEDVKATIAAFRAMGVVIEGPVAGGVTIHGVGLHGLQASAEVLDLGNSGTAMRLFSGVLVGQSFRSELDGDASLRRRPMRRITEPLSAMGARIEATTGTPPLHITPVSGLHGIDYVMPVASAQVKSALLLAGLYAQGQTRVRELAPTRDHTERMLRGFGVKLSVAAGKVAVQPAQRLHPVNLAVPADLSSAAFFLVAASLAGGSNLLLESVGVNPTRCGVLTILQSMGARITRLHEHQVCGEPVADLAVSAAPLQATDIDAEAVALAIDELPVLCIAAAMASGTTRIHGAGELRHKECDRIAAMVAGLQSLGIEIHEHRDGMTIVGGRLQGGQVDSFGDHRIAMAFAVAGHLAQGPVQVRGCENVATSFPGFVEIACQTGFVIEPYRI
ncbi:MAG TPA: 3-phosphoshikimate 1-carboxyvinyltransferase [Gammaproteobacteria bacterium]|nr:3-phosphoshikimate 1-carboxyvinyltransferase [Gammaproteobacteria bacterium]